MIVARDAILLKDSHEKIYIQNFVYWQTVYE